MDNLASLARASDPINFPDNIADDEWRVTKALDDQLARQMPSRRWRPMHDPYAYLAASSSSSPRHRHSGDEEDDSNNDDGVDDASDDSDESDADLVIFKRINTHKVGVQDAADAQIFVPAAPAAVRQPHEAPFGYERDDANMKLLIWLESDSRRPPEKDGMADGDFFLRGSQHGFCWACLDVLGYYIKHTRGGEEEVVGGGREEEEAEEAEDKKRKKGERAAKKTEEWSLRRCDILQGHLRSDQWKPNVHMGLSTDGIIAVSACHDHAGTRKRTKRRATRRSQGGRGWAGLSTPHLS